MPVPRPDEDGGYIHVPRVVEGAKVRERGPDDPYAQATLFWNSMSEVEQDHIADAYTFELGKVEVPGVVERMVATPHARRPRAGPSGSASASVSTCRAPGRCTAGPDALGRHVPDASGGLTESPSLSMVTEDVAPASTGGSCRSSPTTAPTSSASGPCRRPSWTPGSAVHVVATHKGHIRGKRKGDALLVDKSFHTASVRRGRLPRRGRERRARRTTPG